MSDKPKFPYEQARPVAEKLLQMMGAYCEEAVIAGSLRRCRPHVGDIEILYVPKVTFATDDLFAAEKKSVNETDCLLETLLMAGEIEKRANVNGSFCWGVNNKYARHKASGIPVDFFATTRENWWVSLVIRTGSKETNLSLTTGAHKLGRKLNAYGCGVSRQVGLATEIIPATSERHVFELCGVPYREPKDR